MKINELIAEPQIDEGVGDVLGKAAGNIVGATKAAGRGLSGMWKDAKAGYAAGKTAWDPKSEKSTTTPAVPGSAPASSSATAAPATASGDISSILQTIDKLDQPAKQQLAGELEKSIAGGGQPAPAGMPPQGSPVTAPGTTSAATQPAVKRNPNNPDDLGFGFDVGTGLPLKSQAEKDANIAKADAAEKAAATAQQPAAPAAPTTPPASTPTAGASPAVKEPTIPKTPEQTRQEKQATATDAARADMASKSVIPPNIIRPPVKSPAAPAPKPAANYGQQPTGYAKQTTNALTGIPNPMGSVPRPTAAPAPAAAPAQPAGRPQGGGRVAGQLSAAPRAVARRAARTAARTPTAEGINFYSSFLGRIL
jgi:hypothetical protein